MEGYRMTAKEKEWVKEIIKNLMTHGSKDEVLIETICGGKYTLEKILEQVQEETALGKKIINFFLKPRIKELLAQKNLLPKKAA
jgi:uncharacterized membrane-anchored protein